MAITKKILQSAVGYDLTTGLYVIAETIGGVDQYWSGAAWDIFANAHRYTFGTGTLDGDPAWTWQVPAGVDPGNADDLKVRMLGWESGIVPTSGTQAVTDSFGVGADSLITLVSSSATMQVPVPYLDLVCFDNEDRTIQINLVEGNNQPIDLAGHDCTLVVSDWNNSRLFQEDATISGSSSNQIIFTIEAANSHANPDEIWQLQLWDNTVNAILFNGTLTVQPAAAPA